MLLHDIRQSQNEILAEKAYRTLTPTPSTTPPILNHLPHHHHAYTHTYTLYNIHIIIVVCQAYIPSVRIIVLFFIARHLYLLFLFRHSPTTTSSDESLLEISTTCWLHIDKLASQQGWWRKLQNLMKKFTELDGFCCHMGGGHFTTLLVYQYDIVSLYQYESKNVLPMYQYANTTFVWKNCKAK